MLFVVEDALTTMVGLNFFGAAEAHPISDAVLGAAGLAGMIVVKLTFIVLAAIAYNLAPEKTRAGIPFGLCFFGAAIVGWNTAVILLS